MRRHPRDGCGPRSARNGVAEGGLGLLRVGAVERRLDLKRKGLAQLHARRHRHLPQRSREQRPRSARGSAAGSSGARGDSLAAQLAYWRSALGGAPAALELASDRARPSVQSFRGGKASLAAPADEWSWVTELARASQATLMSAVLAAWGTVLSGLSRQAQVVVGVPIAGPREEPAFSRTVGYFINVLGVQLRLQLRVQLP